MKYKVNILDKDNKPVYVGDKFWAYLISPTLALPTEVKVIKDITKENLECDRDYEVVDSEGNKLWNAYLIKHSDRVKDGENIEEYHSKKVSEWSRVYNFKTGEFL